MKDYYLETDSREAKILKNKALVISIVDKQFKYHWSEPEDLISYGMIGLINAIDNYDKERAANFSTFATICIRGEIIKGIAKLKNIIHVSRHTVRSIKAGIKNEKTDAADIILKGMSSVSDITEPYVFDPNDLDNLDEKESWLIKFENSDWVHIGQRRRIRSTSKIIERLQAI